MSLPTRLDIPTLGKEEDGFNSGPRHGMAWLDPEALLGNET